MSEGLWLGFIFPLSTEQHFLNVSVVGKASQPFPLVDDGVIRAVKKEPMTLKGYKCCRFRTTGFYGNWSENRTLNGWITIIQSSQFDQSVSCSKIQPAFLAIICIIFSMVLSMKHCPSNSLFLYRNILSLKEKDKDFPMDGMHPFIDVIKIIRA